MNKIQMKNLWIRKTIMKYQMMKISIGMVRNIEQIQITFAISSEIDTIFIDSTEDHLNQTVYESALDDSQHRNADGEPFEKKFCSTSSFQCHNKL